MTRDELIETGQRVLVIAGTQMEDLSTSMISLVSGPDELVERAETLGSTAADLVILASTAKRLGQLANSAQQ